MSMQIVTNVGAINAQRNLSNTTLRMGKVLEKLSSGFRINRAADDAAGLAISEKMRAQIRGSQQAVRNAKDGISMLQTAEGALDEVHAILQRMRELSVQAANGTYANDGPERTSLGEELIQLRDEINRIAEATEFNGQKLLNGELMTEPTSLAAGSDVQVGETVGNLTISNVSVSGAEPSTTYTLSYSGTAGTDGELTLSDGTNSQTIAIDETLGPDTTFNFDSLGVSISFVGSTADATETNDAMTALAALDVETDAAAGSDGASLHIGANTSIADNTLTLNFEAMSSEGIGLTDDLFSDAESVVANPDLSRGVIDAVDTAIDRVNSHRGSFGAAQNRLEHTIRGLSVAVENLSAAESRIRDADIAELSSDLVSNQILQQAGVSVLSQANTTPQAALALLQ